MASWFPRFIDELIAEHGDEQNTRALLGHLRRMLGRNPRFQDLTERTLSELLQRLAVRLQPVTVRGYRHSLRTICLQAERAGRIDYAPTLPALEQLQGTARRLRSNLPEGQNDRTKRRRRQPDFPRHYRIACPDPSRTLLHFFETSYAPLRLSDGREQTEAVYRSVLNRFAWYLSTDPTFDHLTDDTLEEFLAWSMRSGRSTATANRLRSHLLALWRHAWRKRKVEDLPRDVPKLKEPKRLPQAWTLQEFERIVAAAGEAPGSIAGIPARLYWPALLLTLFDTGLRHNAMMQARTADLDADARTLFVPAAAQKNNSDGLWKLHPDTVRLLLQTAPQERRLLFPWPARQRDIRAAYRRILQAAGLPSGPKDLFHKLRRTSATYLCRATDASTAQRHMGHSHQSVTQRSYLDPRLIGGIDAASLMERPAVRFEGGR